MDEDLLNQLIQVILALQKTGALGSPSESMIGWTHPDPYGGRLARPQAGAGVTILPPAPNKTAEILAGVGNLIGGAGRLGAEIRRIIER